MNGELLIGGTIQDPEMRAVLTLRKKKNKPNKQKKPQPKLKLSTAEFCFSGKVIYPGAEQHYTDVTVSGNKLEVSSLEASQAWNISYCEMWYLSVPLWHFSTENLTTERTVAAFCDCPGKCMNEYSHSAAGSLQYWGTM